MDLPFSLFFFILMNKRGNNRTKQIFFCSFPYLKYSSSIKSRRRRRGERERRNEAGWCPVRAWASGTKLESNLHPPPRYNAPHRYFEGKKKKETKRGEIEDSCTSWSQGTPYITETSSSSSSSSKRLLLVQPLSLSGASRWPTEGWEAVEEQHLRTLVIRLQQLHPECISPRNPSAGSLMAKKSSTTNPVRSPDPPLSSSSGTLRQSTKNQLPDQYRPCFYHHHLGLSNIGKYPAFKGRGTFGSGSCNPRWYCYGWWGRKLEKRDRGEKKCWNPARKRERERAFINDRLCVRVKNSEIICSSRHAIACVAMGRGSNSNSSHL